MRPQYPAAVAALILALSLAAHAATLAADTSRPESSTFATGEPVTATFTATGLAPNTKHVLDVVVKDLHENPIGHATVDVAADATGRWTGTWNAPSDKLGFYRVFPKLDDGTTLPKLASRAAGYFTYAVVPDPAKRVDYGPDDSMFGMQGGFNSKVNVIPYLGVRYVLVGYGWYNTEKDHPGQFAEEVAAAKTAGKDFPAKHPAVENVQYNGKPFPTYVMPGLNAIPPWAAEPGTLGTGSAAIKPSAEGAFSAFCTAASADFAALYPGYKNNLFQVTWEPVYPWGFKGTDQQLVRIYELAYPALHRGNPKAKVLGPTDGGLGDGDAVWTARLFKLGIGKYVDGLTIHPYFPLPPEQNGLIDHIDQLKAVIKQYTGHSLPLYGTEQGCATGEDPGKELLQAYGLIRENLIMIGEGFRINYAFYVHDYPGEPGYGFYYNLQPGAGPGAGKLAPKPVMPAYAAMTNLIEGHRATRRIEWLGPKALGYAYERGDDIVLALWDYSGKPRTVAIPVGNQPVAVYDMMGNVRTVSPIGGEVTLTLSDEPIYVNGVAPSIWGSKAKKPLTVTRSSIDAFPGQTVTIQARTSSVTGKAEVGTLAMTADPELRAKPVTRSVALTAAPSVTPLALKVPAYLPVGRYMARLGLSAGGRSLGVDGVLLNVIAPVDVASIGVTFPGGKPNVVAKLKNRTSAPIGVSASLAVSDLPSKLTPIATKLAAGEERAILFDCAALRPANSRNYAATVSLTTQVGYRSSASADVTFAASPFAAKPPAMDASLGEWSQSATISVEGRARLVRSPQYYDPALASKIKTAWDNDNLYLGFDVTDPVYVQQHVGFDTWKGDCLQVEFNLDPGKKASNSGNAVADAGSVRASEIDFALTSAGSESFRTMSFAPDKLPVRQLTKMEANIVAKQVPGGLQYRIALPWSTIGLAAPPVAGQRIGFAAYVNDMDSPNQLDPAALGLFVDSNTKDPTKFGQLMLVK